jgi:uracil-DNA glycosylase
VTRMRGQWIHRSDGLPVLVTLHPSALLRLRGEGERAAALEAFVDDLRIARDAAPGARRRK